MIAVAVRLRKEGARKPSVIHTLAFKHISIHIFGRIPSRDPLLDPKMVAVHNISMKVI